MKHKIFTDFDDFSRHVRDTDSVMMLQNPIDYIWRLSQVNLDNINVQIGLEGSGNITEGQSSSDGFILFIPLNNSDTYSANGMTLDENSLAILEPGCDFCLRSCSKHDWCSVFIPTSKLIYDDTQRRAVVGFYENDLSSNSPK